MKTSFIFDSYKRFTILLWILIAIVLWYQVYSHVPLGEAILATSCLFLVIFPINHLLGNYLLPQAIKKKKMGIFWIQFVVLGLVMSLLMALVLTVFRVFEQTGLFEPTAFFSNTDTFWTDLANQIPASMVMNLALVGLRFYYEHIKLEKVHLESQLQMLQAQINPHFMFNVLNHIHYYIEKKDDLASILLLQYSDILRYQLYNGKKDSVNLNEEIQFLKNFIDVEKIRWEDKLDIVCSWKIENPNVAITPLLLIPLIENAFKHVSRDSQEKGYIHIDFEQKEGLICLEVENSKSPIQEKPKNGSGLGIENLKNRLNILYGNKSDLLIKETDSVYFSKLEIAAQS